MASKVPRRGVEAAVPADLPQARQAASVSPAPPEMSALSFRAVGQQRAHRKRAILGSQRHLPLSHGYREARAWQWLCERGR